MYKYVEKVSSWSRLTLTFVTLIGVQSVHFQLHFDFMSLAASIPELRVFETEMSSGSYYTPCLLSYTIHVRE